MSGKQIYILFGLIALVALSLFASQEPSDDSTISVPSLPKAIGGECVASPEIMRKNHMVMLQHDRDLKIKDGITNIDYSLKECIACHVVKDDAGMPVSYDSPKHFCRSCHDYVAAKPDCFSCHNSKPDEAVAMIAANPHPTKWPEDKADE